MKKFLGVIVALTMCVCLLLPTAFAADSAIGDVDLGALSSDELAALLGDVDLGDLDLDSILADIEAGDEDALATLEDALAKIQAEVTTTSATGSVDDGSMDMGAIEDMVGDLSGDEMSSLLDTVGGAFSGAGIDLGGFDLGGFDVATVLSGSGSSSEGSTEGGDVASGATDAVTGIVDTLMGGLEALGLDTSMIEGMLDNDIVNFFANMYIGYVGEVEETTTAAPETTKKPAVVTTETPKTGDTSAVIAAIATISVASAAAFVCLKKKEN
ncbi:MAG: LPXTG cell wall anchor domain-containing protein [Clostridia bacterium]|nr:LPXTG cell wall anchor domain-containing protein [Clostridia bacterium]